METYDDGIITVCNLTDQAEPGDMPKQVLVLYKRFFSKISWCPSHGSMPQWV